MKCRLVGIAAGLLLSCSCADATDPRPRFTEFEAPTPATEAHADASADGAVHHDATAGAAGPWLGGPNAVITSLTPSIARSGDAISIAGSGFGDVQGTSAILIGGTLATVVVWSTTHLVVKVPALSNGAYLVETNAVGMRRAPSIRIDQAAASLPMPTFVSLTFDDTYASHQGIEAALAPYGMHATIFVNSVRLGKPGFLSVTQVQDLARAGHEIGGHTLHHLWLPGLDQDEQRRQICDDRAQLMALGLEPRAFAYPGGYYDATTQQVVSACGYVSARLVGGGLAEPLPVADRLAIRISDTMRSVVPLSQLKSWVSRSEATGGWVNLVFHDICAGCSTSALHPQIFADFLAWLFPRAGRGTVVRTVSEMTGGPLLPSVSAAPATAPPGPNFAPNGSFEEGPAASPRCWQRGDPGEKTAAWSRITDASLGAAAEQLDGTLTTNIASRRLRTYRDSGGCAIPIDAPSTYQLSADYKGDSAIALSVSFRDVSGSWGAWQDSPAIAASAIWQRATWRLPTAPSGANGIAIGIVGLDARQLSVDNVAVENVSP